VIINGDELRAIHIFVMEQIFLSSANFDGDSVVHCRMIMQEACLPADSQEESFVEHWSYLFSNQKF